MSIYQTKLGRTKVASGEEKWKKVCVKMNRAISENKRKRVSSFDCEIIVTIKRFWFVIDSAKLDF